MTKRFRKALRNTKRVVDRGNVWEGSGVLDGLEDADPAGPRDHADRGLLLASAHRYDAAVADFEAAVSGGVEDPQVYHALAASSSALGKREAAIRVVAAIAIRSLAAQMLCGLTLTAKPWRIFSPILAGRHSSIPNCGRTDGKIRQYRGATRGQSLGRGAATSRIP